MKQKMVIRVQMQDEKRRSKAMKIAVGFSGVSSAAIEGADRNQIVIVGDGVDSVALTTLLRKRMGFAGALTTLLRKRTGFAELISIAAVEKKKDEKKEEKKEEKKSTESTLAVAWPPGIDLVGANPRTPLSLGRQSSSSSSPGSSSFCSGVEIDVELEYTDYHPQSELEEIPSWRWLSPSFLPQLHAARRQESEETRKVLFSTP